MYLFVNECTHTVCCKFECVHIKVNLVISYDLVHVWIDGGFGRITVDHHNFDKSYMHLGVST